MTALRAAVRGVKLGVAITAVVLIVGGMTFRAFAGPPFADLPAEAGGGAQVTDTRPLAAGSPTALVVEHGGWTGDAPAGMAGVVPGHVVVSLPNGRVVYGGGRMVGMALAQIFDGADHGLTVAAFCR